MKRVLHIVGAMPRAGAETMIMNLYRKIDRREIQFDFLYFSKTQSEYDEEILSMGGKIYYCERGKIGKLFTQIYRTYKILKHNNEISVVHGHTLFNIPFSLLGALFAGIKCRIAHSHNTNDNANNGIIGRFYKSISLLLIHILTTQYVACGKSAGEFLFPKVQRNKIIVLPNSINTKVFTPTAHEDRQKYLDEFEIKLHQKVLLQVGRLEEVKNHKFTLNLIKALQYENIDVKLIIVGSGRMEKELKNFAEYLGVEKQVVWTGVRSDIAALMRISDFLIQPSFFEGFPVVLVEAQATGLPCLVSNTISLECDLGLQLINFLPIETTKLWVDYIATPFYKENKKPSSEKITEVLTKNGFTVEKNLSKLYECYEEN